jgi:hypothetical protein
MKTIFFVLILAVASFAATLALTVTNKTDQPITFTLGRGDIFETVNVSTNTQNFSLAQDYFFSLAPRETRTVTVEALCINQKKAGASNDPVRVTGVRVPRSVPGDQASVWNYMKQRANMF